MRSKNDGADNSVSIRPTKKLYFSYVLLSFAVILSGSV